MSHMSAPYVIPDIKPFRSNDGAEINGRTQWREHLAKNNLVEMGSSDLAAATARHEREKRAAAERAERLAKDAFLKTDWDAVKAEQLPSDERTKTRLWCKVAERIEGRERPTRRQMLRIVVEEVKRTKRSY